MSASRSESRATASLIQGRGLRVGFTLVELLVVIAIVAILAAILMPVFAAAPSAEEIMRRVAENQDRAREARTSYVYDMDVFVRVKRSNGKTAREESRQYVVVPHEKGAKRKLTHVLVHVEPSADETAIAHFLPEEPVNRDAVRLSDCIEQGLPESRSE